MTNDAILQHIHSVLGIHFTLVLFERMSDDQKFLISIEHEPLGYRFATVEAGQTDNEIRGAISRWSRSIPSRVQHLSLRKKARKDAK